jgi:hypothetical protein
MKDSVTIDGVTYRREQPNGKRAVVVVDRGWIFAGDVAEANGRITLTRAVWVFRWESVGFDGVIAKPKSDKVTIRKMDTPVDIPAEAEIFRIPVADDWGLA